MLTLPVGNDDNDCALGIEGVCSTSAVVDDMKEFLQHRGVSVGANDSAELIVDKTLEELDCDDELCILSSAKFARHSNKRDINESMSRLKPEGPAESTKLLNNNNIDEVLSRLEISFPKFYHMPFQMIDFAGEKDSHGHWAVVKGQTITPTELGKIDMVRDVIDQGYDTFGVVLNTDKRTNRGIHWFSLFCDFRSQPYTIEYFNSSGNLPMKQVQAWLIKTESALRDAGKNVRVVALTGMIHQKDSDTECGPYSLYYIYNRLKGVPPENFQQKRVPDRAMIEFRRDLFR